MADRLSEPEWDGDTPLPEDDAIRAAHPTRTGRHDLYAEAMRLVGARHSKGGLVELVNWLLYRLNAAEMNHVAEHNTVTIPLTLAVELNLFEQMKDLGYEPADEH